MAQAIVLVLVGITSTAAVLVGTRGLRLRRADLGPAIGKALECVGSMVVFFAVNAAVGLVVILVGRSMTGVFVSTYSVGDATLVGTSFFQGLLFYCWRELKSRDSGSGVGDS
jgi:hypothetical protein